MVVSSHGAPPALPFSGIWRLGNGAQLANEAAESSGTEALVGISPDGHPPSALDIRDAVDNPTNTMKSRGLMFNPSGPRDTTLDSPFMHAGEASHLSISTNLGRKAAFAVVDGALFAAAAFFTSCQAILFCGTDVGRSGHIRFDVARRDGQALIHVCHRYDAA